MTKVIFVFGLACTLFGVWTIGIPAMLFALAWAGVEKVVDNISVDNGCGMWLVLIVVALVGGMLAMGALGGSLMMEGRL